MWEVRLHPEVEAWFLDLCRQTWYRSAIPLADTRFAEHLAALKAEEQS